MLRHTKTGLLAELAAVAAKHGWDREFTDLEVLDLLFSGGSLIRKVTTVLREYTNDYGFVYTNDPGLCPERGEARCLVRLHVEFNSGMRMDYDFDSRSAYLDGYEVQEFPEGVRPAQPGEVPQFVAREVASVKVPPAPYGRHTVRKLLSNLLDVSQRAEDSYGPEDLQVYMANVPLMMVDKAGKLYIRFGNVQHVTQGADGLFRRVMPNDLAGVELRRAAPGEFSDSDFDFRGLCEVSGA
jgi:hypothetical protein